MGLTGEDMPCLDSGLHPTLAGPSPESGCQSSDALGEIGVPIFR